jgi:hypothetical protein
MLALKYLLMILGAGLFGSAGALVAYDIFLSEQLRRLLSRDKTDAPGAEVRRRLAARRAFGNAAGGFRRDLRYARTGVFDAGGRKSAANG